MSERNNNEGRIIPFRKIEKKNISADQDLTNKIRGAIYAPEGPRLDRAVARLLADPIFGFAAAIGAHGADAPTEQLEQTAQAWTEHFNKAADEIQ